MKVGENIRNLIPLALAAKPAYVPVLLFYTLSNVLFRITGWQARSEFVLKFRFGKFSIAPNCGDLGMIGEIFIQQPYQISPAFVPREGDVCIDVGGNIGCVSILWRLTNKAGRIIAIEPHPITFRRMIQNFDLNQIAAIETVEAAIGNQEGQIEIVIDENNNSMAKVASPDEMIVAGQTKAQVPCRTLDGLLVDRGITHVDFLKIDVEGAEVLCLEGAQTALEVSEKIIVEYHTPELRDSCMRILAAHHFKYEIVGTLIFAQKLRQSDIGFKRDS